MNFTPLSTSILSELVLFLRSSFFSVLTLGEQKCETRLLGFVWHLHSNLHALVVSNMIKCCRGSTEKGFGLLQLETEHNAFANRWGWENTPDIWSESSRCTTNHPGGLSGYTNQGSCMASQWPDHIELFQWHWRGQVKTPIYSTSLHSSRMLHSASLRLDIGIKVIKGWPISLEMVPSWAKGFLQVFKATRTVWILSPVIFSLCWWIIKLLWRFLSNLIDMLWWVAQNGMESNCPFGGQSFLLMTPKLCSLRALNHFWLCQICKYPSWHGKWRSSLA